MIYMRASYVSKNCILNVTDLRAGAKHVIIQLQSQSRFEGGSLNLGIGACVEQQLYDLLVVVVAVI